MYNRSRSRSVRLSQSRHYGPRHSLARLLRQLREYRRRLRRRY